MKLVDNAEDFMAIVAKMCYLAGRHNYHEVAAASRLDDGIWYIQITGPNELAGEMAAIVQASQRGILVTEEQIPGHFDWPAETYIKDSSVVTLRF